MTAANSAVSLRDIIAAHRVVADEFIARARQLPDDVWRVSVEGKWSPGQQAEHVALTWRAYTIEAREGPAVTPDTFAPRYPEYREKVLPRILAGNWFPQGGVAPATVHPDAAPAKERVIRALEECSETFEAAFVEVAERNPARYVRHPYFGALTVVEAAIVDMEHTRHHGRRLLFLPPEPS